MLKEIICHYLNRNFMEIEILHLSFSVTDKRRTRVCTWLALKFMFYCYSENLSDFRLIIARIKSDIVVYKNLKVKLYRSNEFQELEDLVNAVS